MSTSKHAHEMRDGRDAVIRPAAIKLDHSGLPLIPQPTNSLLDPLNYPNVHRFYCFQSVLGSEYRLSGSSAQYWRKSLS